MSEVSDTTSLLQTALRVGMILALLLVATRGLRMLSIRIERRLLEPDAGPVEFAWERRRRVETLTRILRQTVTVILAVTMGLAVLMQLGVQIGPLIASAGIIGLAVGFGAQSLVRDVISGFFMILENQVRVGDVAVVNGTGGLVEAVNLRTLVLRDESGAVHVFPNGAVNTLANMTRQWSAFVFEISVAVREDSERVIRLITEEGRRLREITPFDTVMLGEPEVYGVEKITPTSLVIKGRIRTQPIRQYEVGRAFLKRIHARMNVESIELPKPVPMV